MRLRLPLSLVGLALLIVVGIGYTQPAPTYTVPASELPRAAGTSPAVQAVPVPSPESPQPVAGLPPPVQSAPTKPTPEPTLEEMVQTLKSVRAQRQALERQEQELAKTIQVKLDQLKQELQKLGVGQVEPDRVGRIEILGFPEPDEKRVRDALGVFPGQVVSYPNLEAARARLEKAGFPGSSVEVVPNGPDSQFKDIRVRSAAERNR